MSVYDRRSLSGLKEEISKINVVVSGEPTDSIKISFFGNCDAVEEVCIGPHDPRRMRQLKVQCLAYLVKQSKKDLDEYSNRMRPLQEDVRECYECRDCCSKCYYNINRFSPSELLEMMTLDGCFILEFFRFMFLMLLQDEKVIDSHPIAQMEGRKLLVIFRDLLQLWNQIPYSVLEGLFEICYPLFQREGNKESLLSIIGPISLHALKIIRRRDCLKFLSLDPKVFEMSTGLKGSQPLHLLNLIQLCFVSPEVVKLYTPRDLPQWNFTLFAGNIPCISKLLLAGIKVSRKRGHYLDFAFQKGVFRAATIKMPRIFLNEQTCSFLDNCVKFEHQYTDKPKYISSYVLLLDCLLDTADDVSYLRQRHVLEHCKKTDAEAVDFINNLGRSINFDRINPSFFQLCSDVNSYLSECQMKWASFKREYFEKPWLLVSVFVGLVLLILSCLQTYYTMRPFLYPHN